MLDLTDSRRHLFSGGPRTIYRAYCDQCGRDRGYLLKTAQNDKRLCKHCAHVLLIDSALMDEHPNVDFSDFIDQKEPNGKTRRRYRCSCLECGDDRGYFYRHRWGALCLSCGHPGKPASLESRIQQSCYRRGISTDQFDDFLTPVRKMERVQFDHKGLAYQCFERDNFACCRCGTRGGPLNAHHLSSWHAHPDLRFDLNNLVCLCADCHKSFHRDYGWKNNTLEQYVLYKGTY
jgi:hypothetical protein